MTEKQMRAHLFKIWYRWRKLQDAIYEAHNAGLLVEPDKYEERCSTIVWSLRTKIESCTKDQIAEIIQREIRGRV